MTCRQLARTEANGEQYLQSLGFHLIGSRQGAQQRHILAGLGPSYLFVCVAGRGMFFSTGRVDKNFGVENSILNRKSLEVDPPRAGHQGCAISVRSSANCFAG